MFGRCTEHQTHDEINKNWNQLQLGGAVDAISLTESELHSDTDRQRCNRSHLVVLLLEVLQVQAPVDGLVQVVGREAGAVQRQAG